MKSVLISIKPKWCEKIFHEIGWCMPSAKGKKIYEKRIEVRKSKPNEVPFKAYIYCTGGELLFKDTDGNLYISKYFNYNGQEDAFNCKVIGEFVCEKVEEFHEWQLSPQGEFQEEEQHDLDVFLRESCLTIKEVAEYRKNLPYYKPLYGWHISELKIYDKPKELRDFRKPCSDKYRYCQGCKYGFDIISSDEEEYAIYHGGQYESFKTVCTNIIKRPPQSWCYVEELK